MVSLLSSGIGFQDHGPLIPNALRLPQEPAPVGDTNFGNLGLEQRRAKKAQKQACCSIVHCCSLLHVCAALVVFVQFVAGGG